MLGRLGALAAIALVAVALYRGDAAAIVDAAVPTLTLPASSATNATSSGGAVVSFIAVATDDVRPTSLSCTPASGGLFAPGTTLVACTASDAAGHSASGTFAITVLGPAEELALLRSAVLTLHVVADVEQGLLDKLNAAQASISDGRGKTACNQLGAFRNQVRAQSGKAIPDGAELLRRADEVEAALDCVTSSSPPVLLGPRADVTAETAPGAATATILFTGESGSVACAPSSPATLRVGATRVTCEATSPAGTSTASFLVTVFDREPPVLVLPADITATAPPGASTAVVSYVVTATDNVGISSLVCAPASGSTFPRGTTTVTCTATDTSGNTASGTFKVTVNLAISGRITDRVTGLPLAGVHAVVVDLARGVVGTASSAADGTYSIVAPPGQYRVLVNGDFLVAYTREWWSQKTSFDQADIITLAGSVGGIDAALLPGAFVHGRVTDEVTHQGIGDVGVNAFDALSPCCRRITASGTDPDGSYRFVVPVGSTIKIQFAGGPGFDHVSEWWNDKPTFDTADRLTVNTETFGIDAVLTRGLFIRGHVTRRDGTPIEGLFVNANDGLGACCSFITGSRTNAGGDYEIRVRAGTYKVLFFSRAPFLAADGQTYMDQWWNGAPFFQQATAIVVNADVAGINAVMTPAALIRGRVTDASGAVGIAGVFVSSPDATLPCCQFINGTQTDAAGNYSYGVPLGSRVKVQFRPPPGAPFVGQWWNNKPSFEAADALEMTADRSGIDARLATGFVISGRVTDSASGLALQGIQVSASDATLPCCVDAGGTQTAPDGTYRLVVAGGTYRIHFGDPTNRHMPQFWRNRSGGPDQADPVVVGPDASGIDAALVPAVAIRGRVSDSTGTVPVGGLFVSAQDANQPCCRFLGGAQTDPTGSYSLIVPVGSRVKVEFGVFSGPPPGTRLLGQWWNNKPSFEAADAILASTDVLGIDARLATGFLVSGHVSERGTGVPLANVQVQVIDPAIPCCPFRQVAFTRTNANGDYTVALAAGTYKVQFFEFPPLARPHVQQWWNGKPFEQAADLLVVAADRAGVDAVLDPAVFVRGRVTDATGAVPVAGLFVSAQDATLPCCRFVAGAQTDATGSYSLVVPAGGTVKVEFGVFSGPPPGTRLLGQWWNNKPSFETADLILASADASGIDARLATGFFVSGHVSERGTGAPLAGVQVQAIDPAIPCCPFRTVSHTQTNANGDYVFAVAAGSYKVQFFEPPLGAHPHMQRWWNDKPFDQGADLLVVTADRTAIDAALTPAVFVRGRVTDATGTVGIAGAFVGSPDATAPCCQFINGTQTDATGSYSYIVPLGSRVKVQFGPPPGSRYLTQWWNAKPSFDTADQLDMSTDRNGIDARLESGFVISGTVRGPSGPVANVFVGASVGGPAPCCMGVGGTNTDSTGHYQLTLRAGTYRINFSAPPSARLVAQWWNGVPGGTASFQRAADIVLGPLDAPGRDFDVVSGVLIQGHVTDASTGASLAGVGVAANDGLVPCCEGLAFTGTDAGGNYVMVVPIGRQVRVQFGAGPPHVGQWWNHKPTFDQADLIDASVDRSGIDAALATVP